MADHLPTGIESFDRLLNGGLPVKELTLIYGEAKTGKTTFLLQTTINTATKYKVLYLDVDNTFNINRFNQIADSNDSNISHKILIFHPDTFEHQTTIIENLENYITSITRLIVIDSITTLYQVGYTETVDRFNLNRELVRQLAYLTGLAYQHNLAVLFSSRVRSVFSPESMEIEPVAKRTLLYWPATIIKLKSTKTTNIKQIIIEKSLQDTINYGCELQLREIGFTEIQ